MSLFEVEPYHEINPFSLFGAATIQDTYEAAALEGDEETLEALMESYPREYLETVLGEEDAA